MPPHAPGRARPAGPGSRYPHRCRNAGRLRAGHHRRSACRRAPPRPSQPGPAHRPRRRRGGCYPGVDPYRRGRRPHLRIREGNTLWCWGAAASGELGTGATVDQDLPQQITKPTAGWTSVTAGDQHSCATRSDGTLWCWGRNDGGQLGIGTTTNVGRPHQVTTPAATDWATVTAGNSHTCATRSDTTLWCWGDNSSGGAGQRWPRVSVIRCFADGRVCRPAGKAQDLDGHGAVVRACAGWPPVWEPGGALPDIISFLII